MAWNTLKLSPGDRYGYLTILEESPGRPRANGDIRRMVKCRCDCGNYTIVPLDYLRKKNCTPACGCRRGFNGIGNTKHGLSKARGRHKLYRVWSGIIGRCETQSAGGYEYYGGRGIGICENWRNDPEAFVKWALANGWKPGLQIDRIDNNGDYTPDNCRFVSSRQNARNRSTNRVISFRGESLLLVEWAERLEMPYNALNQRINILKWPVERALTEPLKSRGVDK